MIADRQSRAIAGLSMGDAQTLGIAIPDLDKYAYHRRLRDQPPLGRASPRRSETRSSTSPTPMVSPSEKRSICRTALPLTRVPLAPQRSWM